MSVTLAKPTPVTPSIPLPFTPSQSQTCKLPGHREGLRMNDPETLASALYTLALRGHLPLALKGTNHIAPIDHATCPVCAFLEGTDGGPTDY